MAGAYIHFKFSGNFHIGVFFHRIFDKYQRVRFLIKGLRIGCAFSSRATHGQRFQSAAGGRGDFELNVVVVVLHALIVGVGAAQGKSALAVNGNGILILPVVGSDLFSSVGGDFHCAAGKVHIHLLRVDRMACGCGFL